MNVDECYSTRRFVRHQTGFLTAPNEPYSTERDFLPHKTVHTTPNGISYRTKRAIQHRTGFLTAQDDAYNTERDFLQHKTVHTAPNEPYSTERDFLPHKTVHTAPNGIPYSTRLSVWIGVSTSWLKISFLSPFEIARSLIQGSMMSPFRVTAFPFDLSVPARGDVPFAINRCFCFGFARWSRSGLKWYVVQHGITRIPDQFNYLLLRLFNLLLDDSRNPLWIDPWQPAHTLVCKTLLSFHLTRWPLTQRFHLIADLKHSALTSFYQQQDTLPLDKEKSLAGTLAFISSIGDDPNHIPAVCLG
jgi:hypothetical protein